MPDTKEKFPMMPEKVWWTLRKKFKQTLPANVSLSYLSTVLSIGQETAANIISPLKRIGLINEDGVLQDRANEWRNDEKYTEVCSKMRTELYPQELIDLYPKPTDNDKDSIGSWFAIRSRVGTAAAKKMSSFYILLSEANPSAESEVKVKPRVDKAETKPKSETKVTEIKMQAPVETKKIGGEEAELGIPSININIEVHISSDASTDQIDKIFESMAKHLNIRRKIANG